MPTLQKRLSSRFLAPYTLDEVVNRMSSSPQGIFVSCTDAAVFVKVIGRGACRNSEPLREFGQRKLGEGYRRIFVDLVECEGMDSTFFGVFAGIGLALHEPGSLTLLNLSGESLKAFSNLGLEHLTSVVAMAPGATKIPFPDGAAFQKLPGSDLTAKDRAFDALERAIVMLECHEDLCRIDERNEEKFRDVKQFLREDIARHQSDTKGVPPKERSA